MISVVVSDTGPLISLVLVGRLDLIDRFDSQILIADAVRTELLEGRPSASERDALAAWIAAGGNRLRIVETPSGRLLQRAYDLLEYVPEDMLDHERRTVRREMRNAGENIIRDMAEKVRGGLVGDTTGLVLFEDRRVRKMDFGRACAASRHGPSPSRSRRWMSSLRRKACSTRSRERDGWPAASSLTGAGLKPGTTSRKATT